MPSQRVVFSTIRCGRFVVSVSAVMYLALLIGCGGDPNLGDVRGTITLNGEPLAGAFVTFTPTRSEGVGSTTFGKTADDGTYRMIVTENKVGAYVGENLIRIKTGALKRDGSGVLKETVPDIYNSKSTLRVEVKSGASTHDFKLESSASSNIEKVVDRDR